MLVLALSVLLALLLVQSSSAANPVKIPILLNQLNVHTRRFAQIPRERGEAAKIVCIESHPHSKDLFVCTATKIYSVSPTGKVSLFLDVDGAVRFNTGRRLSTVSKKHGGVRSIAFHTKFRYNRRLYISAMEDRPAKTWGHVYISDVKNPINADSVVIEFRVNPKTKRPIYSSYRSIFRVGMPVYDHPIKGLAFYKSLLYIAHGDASVQSAIAGGGQRNDALGKILRIDPLPKNGRPYSIPSDNPFVRTWRMKSEVWALGFRNPHTICFSRWGILFTADAGRANIEEVNIVLRGRDYGWPKREGTFVHAGGGLVTGIRPLPWSDAKLGFEYPAAQVGHDGRMGAGFIGQAIAGGCPVENGSPMTSSYYYTDFPVSGKLYFSKLWELRRAVTRGPPKSLRQARTRQATIWYDHDNNAKTAPKRFSSLGDVMRSERGLAKEERVDVRMGGGPRGELYWSSKTNGRIYLFTSSLPGGPGGLRN